MKVMINGEKVIIRKKQCSVEYYNKHALSSARKRGVPINNSRYKL